MSPASARRALVVGLALAGCVVIAASIWRAAPQAVRAMRAEHDAYAGMSWTERQAQAGARIPLPMNVFDFYRANLRRGDRYYFQVLDSGFGAFADLETTVRNVGRLYLLPAVEVDSPAEANVVLSWEMDPGLLGLTYARQDRLGLQLFFVSRIAR